MKQKNYILLILVVSTAFILNCKKEISCENCMSGNVPPIANAGTDKIISSPIDSVMLDGSNSRDPDGNITNWNWSKISGPASFTIINPTIALTQVRNLDTGIYRFELKVTDNGGLSHRDTVEVKIMGNSTFNQPPVARAGADQTITLPGSTLILDGSASTDPDNNITGYLWSKISGPSSFNFTNQNSVLTQVTNLIQGEYFFELKVTDAGGLIDRDTLKVKLAQDTSTSLVDVYVAGANNYEPVYWKNGQENSLNGSLSGYEASSIAIDGNNICIAATRVGLRWDEYAAAYWKNGVAAPLGIYAVANAVAISGNDVYVAGWEWIPGGGWEAKYWKNGQEILLSTVSNQSEANSIFIVGADIYIAGNDGNVATYWKNGQAVSLTNGSNQAYAYSIAVVGNDIYVAGAIGNVATYWKNGQPVSLTNGQKQAVARSIAVKGNDIYITGWEGDYWGMPGGTGSVAKYWKNGQVVSLTDGTTYAYSSAIAVHNNDVYVAGIEYSGNTSRAKYWKNGQAIQLTNSVNDSRANSIQVVNR